MLNYLEADYWAAYQDMPAAEFAQFLQLVHGGSPYTLPTLTANWGALSPEVKPALAAQQRSMLEKSVKYCRDVLGI
ncbi:MAG: hypothetical protein KDE54_05240 [Caldilineaceae bacterium]|nr:hypothetical protein [Caldilineaceae bacterium]